MGIAIGLLAWALAGEGGVEAASAPPPPAPAEISYRVRILDMKGLDWRSSFYHRMQPAAQQGAASIWTMDSAHLGELLQAAENVVQAPKVKAASGTSAVLWSQNGSRRYTSQVKRMADAPAGHATRVAFLPKSGTVEEGMRVSVTGRPLDQGVLAVVDIEETRFAAMHTVSIKDGVVAKLPSGRTTEVSTQYEVPEIDRGQVHGEWLIPADGLLVVSVGAHTMADEDGKAILRERVAVIEAEPMAANPRLRGSPRVEIPMPADPVMRRIVVRLSPSELVQRAHLEGSSAPGILPAPIPPSRSLPLVESDEPMVLPPLPDEQVKTSSFEQESTEPRPSPQSPHVAVRLKVDPFARTAAYTEPEGCDEGCCASKPDSAATGWTSATPQTGTIRIPLGKSLAVEIRATVTPRPKD